jgi:hypothetical protein
MKVFILELSQNPKKKYCAVEIPSMKKIFFGAAGYEDFTIHNDDKRKQNYLLRHKKNEDWEDLEKAGTWSRFLLWNKPTLDKSIRDMENRFNIRIFKNF